MTFRSMASKSVRNGIYLMGIAPFLANRNKQAIRILMYHGIDDINFPICHFEKQLRFIKKNFKPFWLSEINEVVDHQKNHVLEKPPIILTFDDGLKNNAINVAPLLEKYKIKATFFLISQLMHGHQMLWNHELFCRLSLMSPSERAGVDSFFSPLATDKTNIKAYIEKVKTWDHEKRTMLLDTLREKEPNLNLTPEMQAKYFIMSADDAKKLPKTVEVASHTQTHPMLDTTDIAFAEQEIVNSKHDLEEMTGRSIQTFCYPNGSLSEEVLTIVKKHYAAAVSVDEGFVDPNNLSLHRLKRIPAAVSMPDFCFRLLRPTS